MLAGVMLLAAAAQVVLASKDPVYSIRVQPPRRIALKWEDRCALLNDRQFFARYRMTKEDFAELVDKCRPYLSLSNKAREDSVTPEIAVSITLRYLAGGQYCDICDVHNIRDSTFFSVKSRTLIALNKALVDEIRFPANDEERRHVAAGFEEKSHGIMKGCIGALDGLAVAIKRPTAADCPNPASYRNRKDFYSVSVQAICDSNRLFIFTSVKCQGSCHDATAFATTAFYNSIGTRVPAPFWVSADDAYGCSETVVTPYPGSYGSGTKEDGFNFWQSGAQRIYIECAFGILVRRWGVLWRPLENSLRENTLIIDVCMKLHNYCSRRNLPESRCTEAGEIDAQGAEPIVYFQDELHTEDVTGRRRDLERSHRREALANALFESGMRRPSISRS